MENLPPVAKEGPVARAIRYFFGDDVFISYARRDATEYAAALAEELSTRNFTCKFDQWSTERVRELITG